MTNEAFRQEILRNLREQRRLRPAMEQADIVKFVFQAMLGMGHLLTDRGTVTECIRRETETLAPDPEEPLWEALSPSWCRINLRRALAERIPPSVIAGLMLAPQKDIPFSRQDVFDLCAAVAASEPALAANTGLPDMVLDESRLPSHSAAYRALYHPAYRVISAEWIPALKAVARIAEMQARAGRLLITIDGPCASGKTTLARRLADVFEANVVHTDDFVIPHAQKTAARLAIPGGNCDSARLVKEVAAPWKAGRAVRYRRYDCRSDRLLPEETLPDGSMLILEGSYCNLPTIRGYADLCLFVDTPPETRTARLRRRESPDSFQRFLDKWIPLENAYFSALRLPDPQCVVLRGS